MVLAQGTWPDPDAKDMCTMPLAHAFAPSVYVGAPVSVNANISSPTYSPSQSPSFPSLYAACERAGMAPRELAGFLYDRLSQHPAGGAPPST
jgi:hypothetical protein